MALRIQPELELAYYKRRTAEAEKAIVEMQTTLNQIAKNGYTKKTA